MRKYCRSNATSKHLGLLLTAAAAALAGGAPTHALAQTVVTWTGTTGNYVDGANWSSGVTPANANNEYLQINNGGTALVNPGDVAEGAFLHLGYAPGDTGTLQLTGGSLTLGELRVGGRATIPDPGNPGQLIPNGGGTGSVVQSGNSALSVTYSPGAEPPVQSLYIGDSGLPSGNTANGSYVIKDSATLAVGIASDDAIVVGTGAGAHAAFTQQDASSVSTTGDFVVARLGATGTYTLSGGTLTTGDSLIIADGLTTAGIDPGIITVGSVTQTDGTANVTGSLELGRRGGNGSYAISGGSLNLSGQFNIGTTSGATDAALLTPVGSFSLSGTGSVTTGPANIFVGFNSTSSTYSPTLTATGSFDVSGGTMTLNNDLFAVGDGSGATGTLNVSGGSLAAGDGHNLEFDIGRKAGSGSATLSGTGSISCYKFYIGGTSLNGNIGHDASFTMTGGTLNVTNEFGLSATPLDGADSVRSFTMTGGTLNTLGFNQNNAGDSTGVTRSVDISGGTLNVTGTLNGGKNVTYDFTGGTISAKTLNLANSTLNISGSADVSLNDYNLAANMGGSTTISGGTVNVTNNWRINNNPTTPPGSLTITGGNVTMASIITGGNAAILNISGGNLSIGSLTLSNGTIFTTDNDISLSSAIVLGSTATAGATTINVNSGSLTLSGPVSLFKNNPSFTLSKTGPGTLTLSGPHTHAAAAALTVYAGTLNLNADVGPNTALNVAGGVTHLNADQSLSSLSITGGLVDLGTRSLTLPSPIDPYLVSYLQSAYNNGAWTGAAGLTSSAARDRADHATGLAYYDNGTQILVKYTWMGDLNLDGRIDADDFALIDRGFAKHLSSWVNGDVNYDGTVTIDDYAVIDAAFAHQNGGLSPAFLSMRQAQFGDAYVSSLIAAVPEPGSLSLLALGTTALLARRRRPRGA